MTGELHELRAAIDAELRGWVSETLQGTGPIAEPIRYAVLAQGKRIRPLLFVGAWEAAGGHTGPVGRAGAGNGSAALHRVALGPELVHTYSLIHDDLPCMDDDDLRRGRPTVHIRYGERAAVLAGAALLPLAIRAVAEGAAGLKLSDPAASRLIGTLTAAAGSDGMVGGQLLDLLAEKERVSFDKLARIHLGKTARLIAACCTMGGIAARAPAAIVDRLTRFGIAIGLAFQTVDDILDVTGSSSRMGKIGGRDAALGKATVPSVLGLDGARARAEEFGREALGEIAPLDGADRLREIGRLVLERDR
ncbi:polyprenyl synthetase family protein [Candidatus Palauibacter sp.]|uniref:polyprenyl synthetase family protein n=1 Tax=Candidatus Palauibacter sp. TaxID=3101350 RepID=UPI003B51C2E8